MIYKLDDLNDDVLRIIIGFLNDNNSLSIEICLLNYVSKRFNSLIKTLDSWCFYGDVVNVGDYFIEIARMNKPILYSEFNNVPINAFLDTMTYACQNDLVDVVKYFNENKIKGVNKNITVYFYFTKNIVKYLYKIAQNSDNVKTYLSGINLKCDYEEDKMYEMLLFLSKNDNNLGRLTYYVLDNECYDYNGGNNYKNIFEVEL